MTILQFGLRENSIPSVASAAARDAFFPTTITVGQKAWRNDVGAMQQWTGATWVTIGAYPIFTGELGVVDQRWDFGVFERYGAIGNNVTDDTAAIRAACAAIQLRGGGTVSAGQPGALYRVFTVGATNANIYGFSGVPVTIDLRGATLAADPAQDWTILNSGSLLGVYFQFHDCPRALIKNAKTTGSHILTTTALPSDPTFRGREFMVVTGACQNVAMEDCDIRNMILVMSVEQPNGSLPSQRTSGPRMSRVYAQNCMYGVQLDNNGDNADLDLTIDDMHRAFIIEDVARGKGKFTVTNNKADCQSGYLPTGFDFTYIDIGSTDCAATTTKISFQWKGSTPGLNANIAFHFNVAYGASNQGGPVLTIAKYQSDGVTPDTLDRGHHMDGLEITGRITGTPDGGATVPCIRMLKTSCFGPGDTWTNLNVHDLTIPDSWCDIGIEAVKDIAHFTDIYCPYGIRIRRSAVPSDPSPPRFGRMLATRVVGATSNKFVVGPGFDGAESYPFVYFTVGNTPYDLGESQFGMLVTNQETSSDQVYHLPSAQLGESIEFTRAKNFKVDLDPAFSTTLSANILAGATTIPCVSITGIGKGDVVVIAGETRTVLAIVDMSTFTITAGMTSGHSSGAAVVRTLTITGQVNPGDIMRLQVVGDSVRLRCAVAGTWTIVQRNGTLRNVTAAADWP